MNEKVKTARLMLDVMSKKMYNVEKEALETIKEILRPCKGEPCLIGSEDFCEDIYYAYGEPKPNEFRRVLAIRLNEETDELEVLLDGKPIGDMNEDGWTKWSRAFIGDTQFLLEEMQNNIEYSDGYQDDDVDE